MASDPVVKLFIAYRRGPAEGDACAQWIHDQLDGKVIALKKDRPARMCMYWDVDAPAGGDWRVKWKADLQSSRALILVCTPGARARRPGEDFLFDEIEWWLRHRKTAPIVIDAGVGGTSCLPEAVRERWSYVQRLRWGPEEVDRLRMLDQIREGLILSAKRVDDEELRRLWWRNAGLAVLIVLAGALGTALYRVAGRSGEQTEQIGDLTKQARETGQRLEATRQEAEDQEKTARSLELARKSRQGATQQVAEELAIAAVEVKDTPAALEQLRAVLEVRLGTLEDAPSAMAVDPAARLVAVGSPYGSAVAADLQRGTRVELCGGSYPVEKLTFSPGGKYLLVERLDFEGNLIEIWNVADGKMTGSFRLESETEKLLFAPNEKAFLVSIDTGRPELRSLPTGRLIGTITAAWGEHAELVFSPSSKSIASLSILTASPVVLWSATTARQIWTSEPHGAWWVRFSADGSHLFATLGPIKANPHPVRIHAWNVEPAGIPEALPSWTETEFSLERLRGESGDTILHFLNLMAPNDCEARDRQFVDASGSIVACEDGQSHILLYRAPFAAESRQVAGAGVRNLRYAQFTADLASMVFIDSDGLGALNLKTREIAWKEPGDYSSQQLWSNGRWIFAIVSVDHREFLSIVTPSTGKERHRIPLEDVRFDDRQMERRGPNEMPNIKQVLSVDSAGRRVIVRGRHVLTVWNAETGKPQLKLGAFDGDAQLLKEDRAALRPTASHDTLLEVAKRRFGSCGAPQAPNVKIPPR